MDAAEEGADTRQAGVVGGGPAGGAVGFGVRDHGSEFEESEGMFVAANAALAVDGAAGGGDKDSGGDKQKKRREKNKKEGGEDYFQYSFGERVKLAVAGDVFQKPRFFNFGDRDLLKNFFVKEVGVNDVQVEINFAVEGFDEDELRFEVGGDNNSAGLLAGDEIFQPVKMVFEAAVRETFNNVVAELGVAGEAGGDFFGGRTGTDEDYFRGCLAVDEKIKSLAPDNFQDENGD